MAVRTVVMLILVLAFLALMLGVIWSLKNAYLP